MCVAMCIGIMLLDVVYVWAANQFGMDNPFLRVAEFSALIVAFNMTIPMVGWMHSRMSRPGQATACGSGSTA